MYRISFGARIIATFSVRFFRKKEDYLIVECYCFRDKNLSGVSDIDHATIKSKLLQEREDLKTLDVTSSEAAQPVELDQSRVGRLSRMDAMQAQAMSLEIKRRLEIQITRIDSALQRLESGKFGDCLRCAEPINSKRLEFDLSVVLCIDCANNAER